MKGGKQNSIKHNGHLGAFSKINQVNHKISDQPSGGKNNEKESLQ